MYKDSIRLSFVAFAILSFAPAAHAIIRRHDRPDQKYLDLGKNHPAVCRLGGGTATLIDRQWLISAGHVSAGLSPFDRAVTIGGRSYTIEGFVRHPEWRPKSGPRSFDIALFKLKKPVEGVTFVELGADRNEKGQQVIFVGPGMVGDGETGPQKDDGQWRGATNVVTGVMKNWITFKFDEPPDGTDMEGISGPGDSGGPALIERDGHTFIIGVSSANDDAGAKGPCRYDSTEYYARVSSAIDWIRETMKSPLPPQEPAGKIVDLKKGRWPKSPAGKVAAAFFQAYAADDDHRMETFEVDYRSESALRQKSASDRVESWKRFRDEWEHLSPRKYVVTGKYDLYVLVHASRDGQCRTFRFTLESGDPHKLTGIAISGPTGPCD